MLQAIRSAASWMESCARWAYLAVVSISLCPSSLPITGSVSPSARALEAKECRRSWIRTSSSFAASRTARQALSSALSLQRPSAALRGNTHGLPARRGSASSSRTAGGGSCTARGPDFASGRRSSPASRSTFRDKGRSSRAWLWTSVSRDAVYFHIDPSRSAEVAKLLFGSTEGTVVLVCDRLSTYKRLARELGGKVILQWCWAHQRRSFIDCAAGHVRLRRWCRRWIRRIAKIYRLNDARLKHYNPALPLERQTPAFDAAQARLKKAVDKLFVDAEAQLAGLSDKALRAKPLRSLLKHREGLCVFVDNPQVPMDNNFAERALRGPVTRGSLCTSLSTV